MAKRGHGQHRQGQGGATAQQPSRPPPGLGREQRGLVGLVVVEQPVQPHHLRVRVARAGLAAAQLQLVQALGQRLEIGPRRPFQPVGQRLGQCIGDGRAHDRRQRALAVTRPHSRNGVGPGPTAQSLRSQASTGKPAAAIRSASRPNDSASRAASAGPGRRVTCQRWMLMPSDGGTTRNLRPSCSPKSSTPQISEQASAHQRDTASVKASSSQPSLANRIRTCAVRPERVSSASIGPSGRARRAAGLAR
jgi:hypothetical protein